MGTGLKRLVKSILLLYLLTFLPLPGMAITKGNADAEYSKGNYVQAIKDYEELLRKNKTADVYYNLGNAYYRTDNIVQAVLAYERALMLSPGDEDIRFNLQMARSKTIDKITPESEMFFVSWWRSLVSLMSADGWAYFSIVFISLSHQRIYRKAGFCIIQFRLEGTRVDITDDTMRDWKAVRLADGREGWVQTSEIEKI